MAHRKVTNETRAALALLPALRAEQGRMRAELAQAQKALSGVDRGELRTDYQDFARRVEYRLEGADRVVTLVEALARGGEVPR